METISSQNSETIRVLNAKFREELAEVHRQLDEKERQNNKDRQAFSEATTAQEKRHQNTIAALNLTLQETVSKFTADTESLRKRKDAEIKQMALESDK